MKETESKSCKKCGDLFFYDKSRVKNLFAWKQKLFCSKECGYSWHKDRYHRFIATSEYLKLRFFILTRDNFICQYCGRGVEDGTKLHVDHIYPESKGGKFEVENLITSCFECNEGKKDVVLEKRLKDKNK